MKTAPIRLLVVTMLCLPAQLMGQARRAPPALPAVQMIRIGPSIGRRAAPMTASIARSMPALDPDEKLLLARNALAGSGTTVDGAEPPLRLTPAMTRIPGRAWIMLNNARMSSEGGEGGEGEFVLGGQSSFLRVYLELTGPPRPHLLDCVAMGKPGPVTVRLSAGSASMATTIHPGWHHVGWLVFPEGSGSYVLELAPGDHQMVTIQYCEITPFH
jgi:hypothetical protein